MSVTLIIVKNLTFTVNGYNPQWKIYLMSDVFNLGWLSSLTSSLLVCVAQPDKELVICCPSYCVRRVSSLGLK